eukprot:m.63990 g.63990  ORF g.63990 m.63990 type:complete len:119 (+) comp11983_c0_seq1:189-545(+)
MAQAAPVGVVEPQGFLKEKLAELKQAQQAELALLQRISEDPKAQTLLKKHGYNIEGATAELAAQAEDAKVRQTIALNDARRAQIELDELKCKHFAYNVLLRRAQRELEVLQQHGVTDD